MTFRSLLVHVSDDPRSDARVDLAARLARTFGAHLVGLAPTGKIVLSHDIGPGLVGLDAVSLLVADLQKQAMERSERFRQRCRAQGLDSFEAVVDEDDAPTALVRRSPCTDLLILGQPEPGSRQRPAVEQVLMRSARPTLLVPHAGHYEQVGRRVLVAWDGGREASRALADALPLLGRAEAVMLMRCARPDDDTAELKPQLDALHQWLMGHGVQAQVRLEVGDIDPGNALLSMAADFSADLMISGAYGHSRWTERILGGATRTLLDTMTLPVLMSH